MPLILSHSLKNVLPAIHAVRFKVLIIAVESLTCDAKARVALADILTLNKNPRHGPAILKSASVPGTLFNIFLYQIEIRLINSARIDSKII